MRTNGSADKLTNVDLTNNVAIHSSSEIHPIMPSHDSPESRATRSASVADLPASDTRRQPWRVWLGGKVDIGFEKQGHDDAVMLKSGVQDNGIAS